MVTIILYLIKRLSSKQYISYESDTFDRRLRKIGITGLGRATHERVLENLTPLVLTQTTALKALDMAELLTVLANIRGSFEQRLNAPLLETEG